MILTYNLAFGVKHTLQNKQNITLDISEEVSNEWQKLYKIKLLFGKYTSDKVNAKRNAKWPHPIMFKITVITLAIKQIVTSS